MEPTVNEKRTNNFFNLNTGKKLNAYDLRISLQQT